MPRGPLDPSPLTAQRLRVLPLPGEIGARDASNSPGPQRTQSVDHFARPLGDAHFGHVHSLYPLDKPVLRRYHSWPLLVGGGAVAPHGLEPLSSPMDVVGVSETRLSADEMVANRVRQRFEHLGIHSLSSVEECFYAAEHYHDKPEVIQAIEHYVMHHVADLRALYDHARACGNHTMCQLLAKRLTVPTRLQDWDHIASPADYEAPAVRSGYHTTVHPLNDSSFVTVSRHAANGTTHLRVWERVDDTDVYVMTLDVKEKLHSHHPGPEIVFACALSAHSFMVDTFMSGTRPVRTIWSRSPAGNVWEPERVVDDALVDPRCLMQPILSCPLSMDVTVVGGRGMRYPMLVTRDGATGSHKLERLRAVDQKRRSDMVAVCRLSEDGFVSAHQEKTAHVWMREHGSSRWRTYSLIHNDEDRNDKDKITCIGRLTDTSFVTGSSDHNEMRVWTFDPESQRYRATTLYQTYDDAGHPVVQDVERYGAVVAVHGLTRDMFVCQRSVADVRVWMRDERQPCGWVSQRLAIAPEAEGAAACVKITAVMLLDANRFMTIEDDRLVRMWQRDDPSQAWVTTPADAHARNVTSATFLGGARVATLSHRRTPCIHVLPGSAYFAQVGAAHAEKLPLTEVLKRGYLWLAAERVRSGEVIDDSDFHWGALDSDSALAELARRRDCDVRNTDGQTFLEYAMQCVVQHDTLDIDVVLKHLQKGAPFCVGDIAYARDNGMLGVLVLMLAQTREYPVPGPERRALEEAIGSLRTAHDVHGCTLIMWAAFLGCTDCVPDLLRDGATVLPELQPGAAPVVPKPCLGYDRFDYAATPFTIDWLITYGAFSSVHLQSLTRGMFSPMVAYDLLKLIATDWPADREMPGSHVVFQETLGFWQHVPWEREFKHGFVPHGDKLRAWGLPACLMARWRSQGQIFRVDPAHGIVQHLEFLRAHVKRRPEGDGVTEIPVKAAGTVPGDRFLESAMGLQDADIRYWLQGFQVSHDGEDGQDYLGLTKNWSSHLSAVLFHPEHPETSIFEATAGNAAAVWPRKSSPERPAGMSQLKLAGLLTGKAIMEGYPLNCLLAPVLIKHILGVPLTIDDLAEWDPAYAATIKRLASDAPVPDDVLADLELPEGVYFAGHRGDESDAARKITQANRKEAAKLLLYHYLHGSRAAELEEFLTHLYMMVPQTLLCRFAAPELSNLISGAPELDVDVWQFSATYSHGGSVISAEEAAAVSLVVTWFWDLMRAWPAERRQELFFLATGLRRMPAQGLTPPFCVHLTGDPTRLPAGHTCNNQLDLPMYGDEITMMDKVNTFVDETDPERMDLT